MAGVGNLGSGGGSSVKRHDWPAILAHAATIVWSYDTGVTLRQLFYRLVSDQTLANTRSDYCQLSARTAEARRAGAFPALMDRTRRIHRYPTFGGPADAREWLAGIYRRDRTEGQEHAVYIAVEKDGLVALLQNWFGDLGVPVVAVRGYASQTYADDIAADVAADGRPAVLLYGGDFDPSGMDIERDAVTRTGCWAHVERVALTPEQIDEHALPPALGKATDTRAGAFVEKYGKLVQVEIDALPPDVLRSLYADALARFFDTSTYQTVMAREAAERRQLEAAA